MLGRLYDGIEYRGFGQSIVEELAKYSKASPSGTAHQNAIPPHADLADMLTIRRALRQPEGPQARVPRRLPLQHGKLPDDRLCQARHALRGQRPEGYFPDPALIARCEASAAETGATLAFETDPAKAVAGADVLYTDVWVSMGEPMEAWAERLEKMLPYQVNQELMDAAGEKALFMHCLPAFHDLNTGIGRQIGEQFHLEALEVTDEVFEGPRSIVFDEAENRMHTIKAVLAATLAN